MRRPLRSLWIAAALVAGSAGFGVVAATAPAGAQTTTTTTAPPVRSIPVTPAAGATTTTTAPSATANSTETAAAPLASTGIAADRLVPLGLLLIGMGAALVGAARRYGRPAYRFL